MSSKPVVNLKRELMVPGRVSLTVRGFTIVVFTNDYGVCVQLTSDEQRPCETPLDEMQRDWDKKTA
jgi:hypothetical protein